MFAPTRRTLTGCMCLVSLVFVLSGCGGAGTGGPPAAGQSDDLLLLQTARLSSLGLSPTSGETAALSRYAAQNGSEPGSPGGGAGPAGATTTRAVPQTDSSAAPLTPGALSGSAESEEAPDPEDPISAGAVDLTGTTPTNRRFAESPRNNPQAADLLDHWGHRRSRGLAAGLRLPDLPVREDAAGLETLRAVAQEGGGTAPDLHAGDDVEVLGAHRGVTYGRWAAGPADRLSIEFDLSRVGQEIQDDPAFRAALERAGKAWSRRIADTWTTWERSGGDLKGWLTGSKSSVEVRVEESGETSTGLEIHVTVGDVPGGLAGFASLNAIHSRGDAWEPHFGSIEIDSEHLQKAGEADLFATMAHEIGHVLGAWMGDAIADAYVSQPTP